MNNINELMVQAAALGLDGLEGFNEGANISKGSWLTSQHKVSDLAASVVLVTDSGSSSSYMSFVSWLWQMQRLFTAPRSSNTTVGSSLPMLYACIDDQTDVVTAFSEPEGKFAAILVCVWNEVTKILRKEVAVCPLAAARAIVYGLQVDTGLLLSE